MAELSFEKQLNSILTKYATEIEEVTVNTLIDAADELITEVQLTAPKSDKNKSHMADTWTKNIEYKNNSVLITVYNAKHSSYPHIIEFGHIVRRKDGFTFVPPNPFLRLAYKRTIQDNAIKNIHLNIGGRIKYVGKRPVRYGDSILKPTSKI